MTAMKSSGWMRSTHSGIVSIVYFSISPVVALTTHAPVASGRLKPRRLR